MAFAFPLDPALDLTLERAIPVPRAAVWRCWTEAALLEQWFCPKPWYVTDTVLDLRPGGRFFTLMHGPEGEEFPNDGAVLEVVPGERLVFTDGLRAGFRPAEKTFFTGVLLLTDAPGGTLYTAHALHGTEENRRTHETMGFHEGWGKALDQLVDLAKTLS